MKIAKHEAIGLLEEELDENSFFNYEYLPDKIRGCLYNGTDLLSHKKEGECYYCDYERLRESEKGLDWMDKTEAWDFYDYWTAKYGEASDEV